MIRKKLVIGNIESSDDKTLIIEREYNKTKSDNKSKLNILSSSQFLYLYL